jgi:hypothetical protein
MAKFQRQITETVDAFECGTDEAPGWFIDATKRGKIIIMNDPKGDVFLCTVKTLEGDMTVRDGDYLIKGAKDEVYPCKPDIFEATYERVDEESA